MRSGKKNDIVEQSVRFAPCIISLYRKLEKDSVCLIIGKQLLRSGTSIGANVHEAQGAQSKADFIAKISIAHKEAYETSYWLRLISESKIINQDELIDLTDETLQIVKILSSILIQ